MNDDSKTANRAPPDRHMLSAIELAVVMKTELELKAEIFDDFLVGDNSWRILLELFIANENVSLTSISMLEGMSATTGLRWIDVLSQQGFVKIAHAANDNRMRSVSLTEHGETKMYGYLEVVRELTRH